LARDGAEVRQSAVRLPNVGQDVVTESGVEEEEGERQPPRLNDAWASSQDMPLSVASGCGSSRDS